MTSKVRNIFARILICAPFLLYGSQTLAFSKPPIDSDGDSVVDASDLCPNTPPNETTNSNGCSPSQLDSDNDGHKDNVDVFPNDANEWADLDSDGIGDNSDTDIDGDGVDNSNDIFPIDPNESSDLDSDGIGDNSDIDIDGDGIDNTQDAFPLNSLESKDLDNDGIGDNSDTDIDGDGVDNAQDIFPLNPLESKDLDNDGIGDNSDTDIDGDGVENILDAFPIDPDESSDLDSDGIGDNSDTDIDGDGIDNAQDAFPLNPLESKDLDNDGIGDNSDTDIDGDGVDNNNDIFPIDPNESSDLDSDGIGDNSDTDIDGDGTLNDIDVFPYDRNEWLDTDSDGTGNNADSDDDNDSMPDDFENSHEGLNPLVHDANEDLDGDGISNLEEFLAGSNPNDKKLIAYSANHLGSIYEIELYSGQIKRIADINPNGFFTPAGAAISPLGILYIADSYSDNLHSINLATGDIELAASLSVDIERIGMSFDNEGTLWMTTENSRLYSVNTSNGVMSLRSAHGVKNIDSLTWNGNTLVGVASNGQNELFSIKRSNSPATLIGDLINVDLNGKSGLTFQANASLWGIEQNGNIFSIDPVSGIAKIESTYDSSRYYFSSLAMAFDTDNDGMPDGWEDAYSLNKLDSNDAQSNHDTDNFSNLEEYLSGTNPTVSDTDYDGVMDHSDTFPTNGSEWIDSDGDSIGNNSDLDDDNDLFVDTIDPFPTDPTKPQWIKQTLLTIPGLSSNSSFSISSDGLGDINTDGYDDFIIGRKTSSYAKVYSGADGSEIYSILGPQYSNFGQVVTNLTDLDGDFINDFAVSAPLFNQVSVYSGASGDELYNWVGGNSYGESISKAGDINNDGTPDIIIGAPSDNQGGTTSRTGSVEVRSGKDGSVIHFIEGNLTKGFLGSAVSDLDDINNDGFDDFVVKVKSSSTSNQSVVSIYSGRDKKVLRMLNVSYGSTFGEYLENVGDIDKDGINDLAISQTETAAGNNGKVYIYSGKTLNFISSKSGETYSKAGNQVASAGDIDNDGTNDYLMNLNTSGDGKVWLVSGANNNTLYEFLPTEVSTNYGYALASAGDVNHDGITDFIIGASKTGHCEILTLLLDSDSDGIPDASDVYPLSPN